MNVYLSFKNPLFWGVGLLSFTLSACSGSDNPSNQTSQESNTSEPFPILNGDWPQFESGLRWQWQLKHQINLNYAVDVYDIDLFDTPVEEIEQLKSAGIKVVCYFSAGSHENWRSDAGQFDSQALGEPLAEWEGERWLDVRNDSFYPIMQARMDLAQSKGCDAVEPDNVDGFLHQTGFDFQPDDQAQYNYLLSTWAHQRGLAIGLKNDLEHVELLADHFDFAVNEECHHYNECDVLNTFTQQNKAVFNAEYDSVYTGNLESRQEACRLSASLGLSTLILPLELDDEFRIECINGVPQS